MGRLSGKRITPPAGRRLSLRMASKTSPASSDNSTSVPRFAANKFMAVGNPPRGTLAGSFPFFRMYSTISDLLA
jgi:hypothetical protein